MKRSICMVIVLASFAGIFIATSRAQDSLDALAAILSAATRSKDPKLCKTVARQMKRLLQEKVQALAQKTQTPDSSKAAAQSNTPRTGALSQNGQTAPSGTRQETSLDLNDAKAAIQR